MPPPRGWLSADMFDLLVEGWLRDLTFIQIHYQPAFSLEKPDVQALLDLVPLAADHDAISIAIRLGTGNYRRNQPANAEFTSGSAPGLKLGSSSYDITVDGRGQTKINLPNNPFGGNSPFTFHFVLQDNSHGYISEFDQNGTGSTTFTCNRPAPPPVPMPSFSLEFHLQIPTACLPR